VWLPIKTETNTRFTVGYIPHNGDCEDDAESHKFYYFIRRLQNEGMRKIKKSYSEIMPVHLNVPFSKLFTKGTRGLKPLFEVAMHI
jgi:hypothetical protein